MNMLDQLFALLGMVLSFALTLPRRTLSLISATPRQVMGVMLAIVLTACGLSDMAQLTRHPNTDMGSKPSSSSFFGIQSADRYLANGWHKPILSWPNRGGYIGWLASNPAFSGLHVALDLAASVGTSVYSIGRGVIVAKSTSVGSYGGEGIAGGGIVVEYRTAAGVRFYALSAHLRNLTSKGVGDTVEAGEVLAEINSYFTAAGNNIPHLHFAVRTGETSSTGVWKGYASSSIVTSEGWQNPETFLNNNAPANPEVNHAELDGACSLISRQNLWGGIKDEFRLHPHQYTGSAAQCQILKLPEVHHVDVVASEDLGDVIVRIKPWDSQTTHTTLRVNLKANTPVSLPLVSFWNVMAISTTRPISETTGVIMTAKSANDAWNGSSQTQANSLPDITNDHFAAGTASLMSHASNGVSGGFATTRDDGVALTSNNSVTTVQWYVQNSCKRVEITSSTGNAINGIDVSVKPWAAPNSSYRHSGCTGLPCMLTAIDGYHIIKIKSPKGSIPTGSLLRAQCK